MPSVFTKIIRGELPCHRVAESDECCAFLDIRPSAKGHTLVVPKTEVDNLFDLDEADYAALMLFARRVARALAAAVECKRVGVLVVGTEVPHAHVHLIPFQRERQVGVTAPTIALSEAEMAEIAASIRAVFE